MADNYIVQVSIKNDLGHMLNIRGDSFQEVGQHLESMYGAEQAKSILDSFGARQAIQTVTASFGQGNVQEVAQPPQAAPAPVGAAPAPAPAPQAQGFGGPPAPVAQPPAQGAPPAGTPAQQVPVQTAPQGQAPACGICGQAKTYRPPGISQRTGKQYNGFWSCSNNRDAFHVQQKAAGVQE